LLEWLKLTFCLDIALKNTFGIFWHSSAFGLFGSIWYLHISLGS
jgi:hypothetical protein